MLSIIIPTLNEENYLPLLLDSIKNQNFSGYEIIVADAGSRDKTVETVRNYDCQLIKGGSPSKGRNNGAKITKGDLFLFLDADVLLPEKFLEKALAEFKKRKLNIASFKLVPIRGKFASLFFNIFYNFPILLLEKILPHASMGILVEKELFWKLNGFDETIKLAEDHELARRAKKLGKFGLIRSTEIFISIRRFEKDGWLITALKYFLCELHMVFFGPVRTDIFNYQFGHYLENEKR
ncbi:MAG: glycosyl transferase family 2 [Candidatus Nealsonbacteria bacterium CG10_big_fil_rev_8_21_14_0_10_36_24]|uniref:Glycosyl transferase family 2 n=1 Tax=Candidatus Nealsonbacteria bacterium CG10_big_fil_rev_8_21_14_0_10_36_24 TaxID=1974710 RepID=A0A2M6NRN4_9BACT|nr:MAG: glycosyl transferase family 2 [Candidatus Nealsonbacteria bacterium CG10_big_fil_rev_8_21_14_0_10_36_24]